MVPARQRFAVHMGLSNYVTGAYLVHIAPWCTYAHIKSESFISHPTITHLFSFQPSHAPLGAYLIYMARGRVETKKDELTLDES
jgi:hypothetical protein